ncbi:hypothetical protein SEUCBS139899_006524 [Sporothrix eucalyptigena]|uniref:DUF7728 domain-containing protein n=1 Tax=Sporothrix eucalyptigena TaxID=1812306 RepID=A0ABP0B747_9PEZI
MLPKALLAAALATSTASAILLPPPTDVEADRQRHHHHKGVGVAAESDDVSLVSPFYHEFTKVKVPCPGCSMQVRKHGHKDHKHHKGGDENDSERTEDNGDEGKIITLTDVPNHINMFFKIDHAENGDRLLANGFELYPNVDIYSGALTAVQVPDHFHHKGKHHHHDDDEEKEEKHHHHDKENDEKDGGREEEEKKDEDDSELKKRHRRHRKHNNNDDEEEKSENKDVETKKHGKHHKEHHEYDMAEVKDGEGKFHGKHHHGKHGKHLVKVPLGYTMQTQAVGQDASNGMEVVALALQIIEVNDAFIQNIPAVNIRLIRTAEGSLMIARIDVGDESEEGKEVDPNQSHRGHHKNGKERMDALKEQLDACSNILCRWKAIISSSINAHHGGCAGKAKAKAIGGKPEGDDEKDGKHRHHHHHHHKEDGDDNDEDAVVSVHRVHHHSFARLAKKFAAHILFPILFGVVAGVVVSLVGMAAGTVIVGLYRMVFRRNQAAVAGARAAKAASTVEVRHADEEAVEEEKAGLISTASEELPPYQDNDTKGTH